MKDGYANALPVLNEVIQSFELRGVERNLPIVSDGRTHIVLHWLGFMIGETGHAHLIEQAALRWAAEVGGSLITRLWVLGFEYAPVACLARPALLPFLRALDPRTAKGDKMVAALESLEGHQADDFKATAITAPPRTSQVLAASRWESSSTLKEEQMLKIAKLAAQRVVLADIASAVPCSKSAVSRFLTGNYASKAARQFYEKYGVPAATVPAE